VRPTVRTEMLSPQRVIDPAVLAPLRAPPACQIQMFLRRVAFHLASDALASARRRTIVGSLPDGAAHSVIESLVTATQYAVLRCETLNRHDLSIHPRSGTDAAWGVVVGCGALLPLITFQD
jgi:hypothetical protein